MRKRTQEEFITLATAKHNGFYDYGKTIYKHSKEKVIITCPTHGDFLREPNEHLQGCGCKACAIENNSKILLERKGLEFFEKAKEIHGDKFDYSKAIYTGALNTLTIICSKHGEFEQLPYVHLRGNGCKQCANEEAIGFSRSGFTKKYKIGGLYIVKLQNSNEEFIKVGITGLSIKERCRWNTYNTETITFIEDKAGVIWDLEKYLHGNLLQYGYNPSVIFGGHTECFTLEALNYIPELLQNNPIIKINESISS